jgi:hypothetical protein
MSRAHDDVVKAGRSMESAHTGQHFVFSNPEIHCHQGQDIGVLHGECADIASLCHLAELSVLQWFRES